MFVGNCLESRERLGRVVELRLFVVKEGERRDERYSFS